MYIIKKFNDYLIKENYNQALSLSKKHEVDISPVLTLLLSGDNNITDDKYTVPYTKSREIKNRAYIGLFTRLYIENGKDISLLRPIINFLENNNQFVLKVKSNETNNVYELKNILDIFKTTDIINDGRKALEILSDSIVQFEKDKTVKIWKNELPRNLKNEVIDDDIYQYLLPYHDLSDIDKKDIYDNFFGSKGKISAYKDIKSFYKDLSDIIDRKGLDFNELLRLAESRKEKDVDIRYINAEKEILVLSIHSFKASQIFGEKVSWCISRTENYFNSYYSPGESHLIFIINKNATDINDTKIGININKFGEIEAAIEAAHNKNDDSLDVNYIDSYLKQYAIPESVVRYKDTKVSRLIQSIGRNKDLTEYFVSNNTDMISLILDIKDMNSFYQKLTAPIVKYFLNNPEMFIEYVKDTNLNLEALRYIIRECIELFLTFYENLWNVKLDLHIDGGTLVDIIDYEYEHKSRKIYDILRFFKKINSKNLDNITKFGYFISLFRLDKTPDISALTFKDSVIITEYYTIYAIEDVYEKGITLSYIQEYCGVKDFIFKKDLEDKYKENIDENILSIKPEDKDLIAKYNRYIEKNGEEDFQRAFSKVNITYMFDIVQHILTNPGFKYDISLINMKLDMDDILSQYTGDIEAIRFFIKNNEFSEAEYNRLLYAENPLLADLIPARTFIRKIKHDNSYDLKKYIRANYERINKNVFHNFDVMNIIANQLPSNSGEYFKPIIDGFGLSYDKIYSKGNDMNSVSDAFFEYLVDADLLPHNQKLSGRYEYDENRVKIGKEKFGLVV